jgi:sec-independent protein translocase protein TatB
MFDIGWSELVVIGVVALIAIGPKELPGVLRAVGQWMGKIRRMASEFQGQFQEAMREAEMADLKKSVDEMTETAKSYTNFDPIGIVRNEIESLSADKSPAPTAEAAAPTTSEAAPAAMPDTAPPAPETPAVADAPATAPEQKPGGAA